MPAGVPTATFAVGEAGATNAPFAVSMLAANGDADLSKIRRIQSKQRKRSKIANFHLLDNRMNPEKTLGLV